MVAVGRFKHITAGLQWSGKQIQIFFFPIMENHGICYLSGTYGGMDGWLAILGALQQYFDHIRMMGR